MHVVVSNDPVHHFIDLIKGHFGVALDFDDTIACSEFVAAAVTAKLINPLLEAAGESPLTPEFVCRNYSGLNFKIQARMIQEAYGIKIPDEVIAQKNTKNLEALALDSLAIPGIENFLEFLQDFGIKTIVLTASAPDRVQITAECAGLDRFLTTDQSDDTRIPVISAGVTKSWQGQDIPPLPHKPDPAGYVWVAGAMGLQPEQVIAFEDSETGIRAARDANYGRIGIVSLSRRCKLIENHADSLIGIVGDPSKHVLVNDSWFDAVHNMMEFGLAKARSAGVANLPTEVPAAVRTWLEEAFTPITYWRPLMEQKKAAAGGYQNYQGGVARIAAGPVFVG